MHFTSVSTIRQLALVLSAGQLGLDLGILLAPEVAQVVGHLDGRWLGRIYFLAYSK